VSLLRPIIRACAVGALRDRTWAENRVYDSDNTPLVEALLGQTDPVTRQPVQKPYITVYTDTDDLPEGVNSEIYNGATRLLNVVMEIGVASAIRNAKDQIVLQFAHTDQGMEWAVDIIESQALAALVGDPKSPWGELFKKFIRKVNRIPSRRGGQAEKGVRFAARRTVLVCNTIFDLAPNVVPPLNHPVWQFIEMARHSNPVVGLVDLATIVSNLLAETNQAPSWRVAQSYLGLTKEAVLALNPDGTPLPWPEVEQPPLDYTDTSEWVPPSSDIVLADSDVSPFFIDGELTGQGSVTADATVVTL
jgi:hypothetical protein